jgi:Xaa-Pro aminopeptidase
MAGGAPVNERIERLRELLEEPLLVTSLVNVRYLTGFESSNAALLVESERLLLFSDFRYAEIARALDGVEFFESARALVTDLPAHLSGRIGFETGGDEAPGLSFREWDALQRDGVDLVPRSGLVEQLRAVKDDDELDTIRRAAEVTDRAYERFADERFIGRTERELAWRMEQLLREEGGHDRAFEPIVAAGPNAALPHAHPGDRRIEPRETVVVDAGAQVDGYCSDCTRTFATGPLPDRLRDAYVVCLQGQLAAAEGIRAGITGREADALAREPIDASEFEGLFGHGLGHGVGMLVHEAPGVRKESDEVLADGNVLTIEPGIYIPGEGGIRIEDLVVVREDGVEVLSHFSKDLIEVS